MGEGGPDPNIISISGRDSLGNYAALASLGPWGMAAGTVPVPFGSGVYVFLRTYDPRGRKNAHELELEGEALLKTLGEAVGGARKAIANRALDNAGIRHDGKEIDGQYLPRGAVVKEAGSRGGYELLTGRPFAPVLETGLFGECVGISLAAADEYSPSRMRFLHDGESGLLLPMPFDVASYVMDKLKYFKRAGRVLVASPFGAAASRPSSAGFFSSDDSVLDAGPVSYRSDCSAAAREAAQRNYDDLVWKHGPAIPAPRAVLAAALSANELTAEGSSARMDESTHVMLVRATDVEYRDFLDLSAIERAASAIQPNYTN